MTQAKLELGIVAVLGFISHFRFQKLLNNSRESNNARSITHKIRYFQELNLMLAIILLDCALSFIILSADGLTGRKYLNEHKFTADLLICNINVTSMITWFLVFLIFHPKPLNSATGSSMQQPAHDFLSSSKPLDGFSGAPTTLMVQPSQASSDYLHYTESAITVPVQHHYSNTNAFQLGPLPAQSGNVEEMKQPLSPSSTPSTATLVSQHRYSGRKDGKQELRASQQAVMPPQPQQQQQQVPAQQQQQQPGHVAVTLSDGHHPQQLELLSTSPQQLMPNAATGNAPMNGGVPAGQEGDWNNDKNVRRQNSNDSMWLQQTPRGGNR